MIELFTRVCTDNQPKWLVEIPTELLTPDEVDMRTHIINYWTKYKKAPSLKNVMDKFEFFIPYKFTGSLLEPEPDPIGAVYDRSINVRLNDLSAQLLQETLTELEDFSSFPMSNLHKIEQLHGLVQGVHRYSTFDRTTYFRTGKMSIPFKLINKQIGKLANGDFMLLVGKLGTGKSTIAQWMAKCAWEQDQRILFVSAEMLAADVFARIDGMVGTFNPLRLRTSTAEDMKSELDGVSRVISEREGEIIVPRRRLLSPGEIQSFAQNMNVDLIIVDGVYLLDSNSKYQKAKWEKVSDVSNQLKQMALDLQIPLIGTAQIKRGADGADGYDPEDIALANALGQDADFVVATYPDPVADDIAQLQLIKNRYGDTITTQISIDYDTMKIIEESFEGVGGKWETMSAEEFLATKS